MQNFSNGDDDDDDDDHDDEEELLPAYEPSRRSSRASSYTTFPFGLGGGSSSSTSSEIELSSLRLSTRSNTALRKELRLGEYSNLKGTDSAGKRIMENMSKGNLINYILGQHGH